MITIWRSCVCMHIFERGSLVGDFSYRWVAGELPLFAECNKVSVPTVVEPEPGEASYNQAQGQDVPHGWPPSLEPVIVMLGRYNWRSQKS